jgi:hypothetical protein
MESKCSVAHRFRTTALNDIKHFLFQECTPVTVNDTDSYGGPSEVKCTNVTRKVCENIPAKIPRVNFVPKYETFLKETIDSTVGPRYSVLFAFCSLYCLHTTKLKNIEHLTNIWKKNWGSPAPHQK